jgi:choline dehydrogenase-like flavoprotein
MRLPADGRHYQAVAEHYDVIVAGSGAGGGTLAHTLAPSGKRILLLERGNFLPRETGNWNPGSVFVDGRYMSPEQWFDADGKPFQPQVHYYVGGATKRYGAALYRLRPGVVISAGAANSAKIQLRSASDQHPAGLANGSDQVGRNCMYHNNGQRDPRRRALDAPDGITG